MGTPRFLSTSFETLKPYVSTIQAFARVKMVSADTFDLSGAADDDIGTCLEGSDLNGYRTVRLSNDVGTHIFIANGAITQYAPVYQAAAGKVSATRSGRPSIGIAMNTTTGDGQYVTVLRTGMGGVMPWTNSIVAASAVAGATGAIETFDKKLTIPAGIIRAGDVLEIEGMVTVATQNGTNTHLLQLAIAGTSIASTGACDPANNDYATFKAFVQFRDIGAVGHYLASTKVFFGNAAGSIMSGIDTVIKQSTAIDTTAAIDITGTVTCSAASANNQDRLDILAGKLIRAA